MGKTISVCNQKGGTGKTTTAVNLAAALATLGKRVLLVDSDPQGNATSGLGVNKNTIERSVYDVLLGRSTIKEVIIKTETFNLDIAPCNVNLTGAEIELVGSLSRETRLKRALALVIKDYDYIFIDTPPSLGLLTLNALAASDSTLIPIQCEFYAMEGLGQLIKTISLVKENLNDSLTIEGILMTMADNRTNLTDQVIKEIRTHFGEKVYKTVIPRSIKIGEAPGFGKPIMFYDKNSTGCKKYEEFAAEFIEINVSNSQTVTSEEKWIAETS